MSDKTNVHLMNQLGRCLRTALVNYETRTPPNPATGLNEHALSDIEVDLEKALECVQELMQRIRSDWHVA